MHIWVDYLHYLNQGIADMDTIVCASYKSGRVVVVFLLQHDVQGNRYCRY